MKRSLFCIILALSATVAIAAPPRLAIVVNAPVGVPDFDGERAEAVARILGSLISDDVTLVSSGSPLAATAACAAADAPVYQSCLMLHSAFFANARGAAAPIPSGADALLVVSFDRKNISLGDGVFYLIERGGGWNSSSFHVGLTPSGDQLWVRATVAQQAAQLGLDVVATEPSSFSYIHRHATVFCDALLAVPAKLARSEK